MTEGIRPFDPNTPGDPELAAYMARLKPKPPVEKIVRTEWLDTAVNREKLGPSMMRRIVKLECGHQAVTKNARVAKCLACHKIIMAGQDYDAFRNHR